MTGYRPGQTTSLDCSKKAKIGRDRSPHLVLRLAATFFFAFRPRGMVEVEVKERVGGGKLLGLVAFELLSGVFVSSKN
jgi:hypothetical protein